MNFGNNQQKSAVGAKTCAFPNCNRPCFVENSKVHNYCGKSHAAEHKKILEQFAQQQAPKVNNGFSGNPTNKPPSSLAPNQMSYNQNTFGQNSMNNSSVAMGSNLTGFNNRQAPVMGQQMNQQQIAMGNNFYNMQNQGQAPQQKMGGFQHQNMFSSPNIQQQNQFSNNGYNTNSMMGGPQQPFGNQQAFSNQNSFQQNPMNNFSPQQGPFGNQPQQPMGMQMSQNGMGRGFNQQPQFNNSNEMYASTFQQQQQFSYNPNA